MKIDSFRCLSGNILKIIAAICMVIDHIGMIFFPSVVVYRIIGRITFPIFAFMIAEGAKYTRNKWKYLGLVAGLGLICELFYIFAMNDYYMCILVTFTLAIITIYALQYFKKCLFDKEANTSDVLFSAFLFIVSVAFVVVANHFLTIDYGFFGCMAPVMVSLFDFKNLDVPKWLRTLDNLYVRILLLGVSLVGIYSVSGGYRLYALIGLLPLCLYSEKRGRVNMKYFFYIFYPVHLVILQGIAMLIYSV